MIWRVAVGVALGLLVVLGLVGGVAVRLAGVAVCQQQENDQANRILSKYTDVATSRAAMADPEVGRRARELRDAEIAAVRGEPPCRWWRPGTYTLNRDGWTFHPRRW